MSRDSAGIEIVNGRFWVEFLSAHRCSSFADARNDLNRCFWVKRIETVSLEMKPEDAQDAT